MATNFIYPNSDHGPFRSCFLTCAGWLTTEDVSGPLPPIDEPEQRPDDEEADSLTADDDSRWDAFLPDDDELDPLPEPGDFWFDGD